VVHLSIGVSLVAREKDMSAVLLAVFNDYEAAEHVRTGLVRDGFPTDRVELTACCDPGRAGMQPAKSEHDRFFQYFRTLFCSAEEQRYAEQLVERLEGGAATVTVHPRGLIEAARAKEIFFGGDAMEIAEHDIDNQAMEYAASRQEGAWMRHVLLESTTEYHCIYCRMFGARGEENAN
jgi:hypothetical protein